MNTSNKGFVILSGAKPWFQCGDVANLAPAASKVVKKAPAKSRAAAKGLPETLYPVLLQVVDIVDDPFWKSIFRDAAIGKFSRGFQFKNGILSYKIQNKLSSCVVDMTTPQTAMSTVRSFMSTSATVLSVLDVENRRLERQAKMIKITEVEINSWSQVKTAPHRSVLITRFLCKVTDSLSLTALQAESLERIIRLGMVVGYFGVNTIHVSKGFITHIDGLGRAADLSFTVDTEALRVKVKKVSKSKRPPVEDVDDDDADVGPQRANVSFIKQWIKFLTSLEKRSTKNKASEQTEALSAIPESTSSAEDGSNEGVSGDTPVTSPNV